MLEQDLAMLSSKDTHNFLHIYSWRNHNKNQNLICVFCFLVVVQIIFSSLY
jgi:hypothetical protein